MKGESREVVIIGVMIVFLFVICAKFSADYEAMQARANHLEANMENVHEIMNELKEYIKKDVSNRLDFFEVMDRALTVGVIKHKHYENGDVYFGEMKECKKFCNER